MIAYGYDKFGHFTSLCECQCDPVGSITEGHDCFLVPAMATLVAPPEFNQNTQDCVWDGQAWVISDKPKLPEMDELPDSDVASLMDRLEAQVTYTAIMTDTLLEE